MWWWMDERTDVNQITAAYKQLFRYGKEKALLAFKDPGRLRLQIKPPFKTNANICESNYLLKSNSNMKRQKLGDQTM